MPSLEEAKQRYAKMAEESNAEARQAALEVQGEELGEEQVQDLSDPVMTPLAESDEEPTDELEESLRVVELRSAHRGWFRDPVRLDACMRLLISAAEEMADPDGLVGPEPESA